MDETEPLGEDASGNMEAFEFLLGQLFALVGKADNNPQAWVEQNLVGTAEKIAGSAMTAPRKAAAQGTVRRVMQIASHLLAEGGNGTALGIH